MMGALRCRRSLARNLGWGGVKSLVHFISVPRHV
jgi:hypothetical protein